jgi:ADP-dependent NAD(P)H-hydrate dehydratase / NAD(P)H-hydrate epimerase
VITVRDVAQVRAAEEAAFREVPEGALMQRAAWALAASCARLLSSARGGVVGARVLLLVGSGNNGGDALWAGARLAARGCRVDALCLADRCHAEGSAALRRAGGHLHRLDLASDAHARLIADADVVVDGILGIGGAGPLRAEAASLAEALAEAGPVVVSVDVPSGVDADTGAVAGAAIDATVTVTFGALKPGLLLAPGRYRSGTVQLVDIGLGFEAEPAARVLEGVDVAAWVPEPAEDAYKYRRGVVGVCAGSRAYPGAALLTMSAARHGNVGMARYLDRADGNATVVVTAFPDVVVDGSPPADQARATAWACGPGFPGDDLDALSVREVLAATVPVVLDAGALSVVASSAEIRARLVERAEHGLVTVLTPHEGEFERLAPGLLASSGSRLAAARSAAVDRGAVVVLKGPGTVIAGPGGEAFIDVEGTADLGTAGSGDVLTGLVGAVLAGAWASGCRDPSGLVEAVAAAVWLHGRAGSLAGHDAPVTATDIAASVPAAIRSARFGDAR